MAWGLIFQPSFFPHDSAPISLQLQHVQQQLLHPHQESLTLPLCSPQPRLCSVLPTAAGFRAAELRLEARIEWKRSVGGGGGSCSLHHQNSVQVLINKERAIDTEMCDVGGGLLSLGKLP